MKEQNSRLPITLQILKDEFDEMADNSKCKPDPNYDLLECLEELFGDELWIMDDKILIIQCPNCGEWSYYNGGFTDSCSCCRFYNLADYSDEAITLWDYMTSQEDFTDYLA